MTPRRLWASLLGSCLLVVSACNSGKLAGPDPIGADLAEETPKPSD